MNDDAAHHEPESLAAQYNRELLEAKTEALKVLADLLKTTKDSTEARRIARAILSVKPIAPAQPKPPEPAPAPASEPLSRHALGTLHLESAALPVHDHAADAGGANPAQPGAIALIPSREPPQCGGPAGTRPLPMPLGMPRA